jgi:UDP-N-acetyl-D-mannosaminuronic acid dehydrogenase
VEEYPSDICIVGGLGHVGLPLGIMFATKGLKVSLYDIDKKSAEKVKRGEMPFVEYGAEERLKQVLATGTLDISDNLECVSNSRYVIITIGTPVDEYLNPKLREFFEFFSNIQPYLSTDQVIIVRSSVFPTACEKIAQLLRKATDIDEWNVAYCPERIVQGYAVQELETLPQLVAGTTEVAIEGASQLFRNLTKTIIRTSIREAELAKLFSNSWRYIQFATANQFYQICENYDTSYDQVRKAMITGYERGRGLPTAGFAAGPCLLKDTIQLIALTGNNFQLGQAAMLANEGLPNFIVEMLKKENDLTDLTIGILGMAFKADIDDIRDSLSYKLGKLLRFEGATVMYSDEFASDPTFVTKDDLLAQSDIVVVGVPHSKYRGISWPSGVKVVDLWGITHG